LERDMSQAELAKATGLHRTEISMIERGRRRRPVLETLVSFARAFGMTASALVDELDPDKLQMRSRPLPGQKATRKARRKREK
jgi:transcriptional regulator with XRE-family HTH domain